MAKRKKKSQPDDDDAINESLKQALKALEPERRTWEERQAAMLARVEKARQMRKKFRSN